MKKENITSIIVGAVCLIVCLGIISDWTAIKGGFAQIEYTWLKVFVSVCIASPFAGLIGCIYSIVKGGK